MKTAKDGIRSIVKIGYDGTVYKTFRGTDRDKRFANEVKVLRVLEARGCDFVPRLLDSDEESLTITTTNCGAPVERLSKEKTKTLFDALEAEFGVVHDDPFDRNITYNERMGRFCIIDFELAEIKKDPNESGKQHTRRNLDWCGLSRDGKRRKGNQDSLSVFASTEGTASECKLADQRSIDETGLIFAVSDGMGGHGGGEVASRLIVQELHRFLPAMLGDFRGNAEPLALLETAVQAVNDHVGRIASKNAHLSEMGATIVCGLFHRAEMHFAHVGDSRLYRYREGNLEQLTFDHSFVGSLFHSGQINEREARSHPQRNILTQAVGAHCRVVHPQVGHSTLRPGDWFLICSDGLTDGLWNKNIAQAFEAGINSDKSATEVAEHLLDWSYDESGKDDTTLFVIKVKDDDEMES